MDFTIIHSFSRLLREAVFSTFRQASWLPE